MRFQFRSDSSGAVQVYGLHTRPGGSADSVPITHARWDAGKSAMVADLGGISITWTPNDGPLATAPTATPGIPVNLDNLLVHPIPEGRDSQITTYPGQGLEDITWQDTIIVFPADSEVPPLYLVFTQPGYYPAPISLPAFPEAKRAPMKTYVKGGGKKRQRWKDLSGTIYEWDYQHGTVEVYSKQGNHLGEFNPISGERTKPANPGRKVEK
ncbi:colicin E3/pyocin S6 family cytotoxin [Pseudomonas sp. 273]|uniref:colicin E3/pyocin S6 family cytotoxin n=1 Tax=Pseudomonas sp. 273 TaxID=75692 RepID=UPI0023D862BC|nr:colicin E3/pyocin S6 family cytotoxin [Pseudomonas sp. 273]